jgi:hypothetical protein
MFYLILEVVKKKGLNFGANLTKNIDKKNIIKKFKKADLIST